MPDRAAARPRPNRPLALLGALLLSGLAGAQPAAPAAGVRDMAGTWDVEEWMWDAPGAKPTPLPPAVAQRRALGEDFIEESMTTPAGAPAAFTRLAWFGYNRVSGAYEYASVDTRAPQTMNERSAPMPATAEGTRGVSLQGGVFRVPRWGRSVDVSFRYRLVVGPVRDGRQELGLYLTPLAPPAREFLAFRYVYTRRD